MKKEKQIEMLEYIFNIEGIETEYSLDTIEEYEDMYKDYVHEILGYLLEDSFESDDERWDLEDEYDSTAVNYNSNRLVEWFKKYHRL